MAQIIDFAKFGNGHDGSPAVSGVINSYATCSGSAGSTSLTTSLSASAGDIVLIHQTQGTGVGQWEVNYVLADAGATLTLALPLAYTYGSGAQVVLMPQYTGGTLSGSVSATSFGSGYGGIIALMCNGELNITGTLAVNGVAGSKFVSSGSRSGAGIGGGFSGGNGYNSSGGGGTADSGAGTPGAGSASRLANGNGGGGGEGNDWGGGAGGGHASTGGAGYSNEAGHEAVGGSAVGNASLTSLNLGGGGGGGAKNYAYNVAGGGSGGGAIIIFAKSIITSSATGLTVNGGNGGGLDLTGDGGAGGGGAGGSILIKCVTGSFGTNKLQASGGSGATGGRNSGSGSSGRIHVDYFAPAISGSTSYPSIDSSQDINLKPTIYSGMV